MEKRDFETRVATIQFRKKICHVKIKKGSVVYVEDIKEVDVIFKKLAGNSSISICADISQIKYITFKSQTISLKVSSKR